MVDIGRAQRRWTRRRVVPLVLATLFATSVLAFVALAPAPFWVRIPSITLAALLSVPLLLMLVETASSCRLLAASQRREAQRVRRELRGQRDIALLSLGLLACLAQVTALMPREDRTESSPPVAMALPVSSAVQPAQAPARVGPPESAGTAVVIPGRSEAVSHAPVRINALEGAMLAVGQDEGEPGREKTPPERNNAFGLRLQDLGGVFERPAMPDEQDPLAARPEVVGFDALYLTGDDGTRGGGASFVLDFPVNRTWSIELTLFTAVLDDAKEDPDFDEGFRWHRFTLAYAWHPFGFTRHAEFDLTVSLGLSVDAFEMPEDGGPVSGSGRMSPYVGMDAAIWQGDTVSILLHAGQSVPVNLTSFSSAVTDLSAAVRIELSASASIRLGYRYAYARLRDYDRSLHGDLTAEWDSALTGPFVGFEFRF